MLNISQLFILFLITLFLSSSNCFNFWTWLIPNDEYDDDVVGNNMHISHQSGHKVETFELGTSEHSKFIKEHGDFIDKPPLDRCQFEVISRLRGSCLSITEEALGKLSVSLLNCQAMAEKRQQYPCDGDMELHECTRDMSEATWSAYQTISNRARAVCYHVRQEQFSRQTELAVNRLAQSASQQITSMASLRNAMQGTFDSLATNQKELAGHQEEMAIFYNNMDNKLKSSMSNINDKTLFFNSLGDQIFKNLHRLDFLMKNITVEINKSRIENEIEYTKTITNLFELQKALLEAHNSILILSTAGLQVQEIISNLRNMSLTTAQDNIELIQSLQQSILQSHNEFAKFNKSLSDFYSQETSRSLIDTKSNLIECFISLLFLFFIMINLRPNRQLILILTIYSFFFIATYLKTNEVLYFAIYIIGVVIIILLDLLIKTFNYFNIINHNNIFPDMNNNNSISSSSSVVYDEQKTHIRYDLVDQLSESNFNTHYDKTRLLAPPGSPGSRSTSSFLTNVSNLSHGALRCQTTTKNGNVCKRPAIKGAIFCSQHFKSSIN